MLNKEQLALLDFLVLLRARRIVGMAGSTFSLLLRELRALRGVPKATTQLLGNIKPAFQVSGLLACVRCIFSWRHKLGCLGCIAALHTAAASLVDARNDSVALLSSSRRKHCWWQRTWGQSRVC